ncbi:hypothetical protein GCM10010975_26690 [Comamonas phosphati]|nr:hypothetical protein GCM10010975_26690 [Comamonas phosphati]
MGNGVPGLRCSGGDGLQVAYRLMSVHVHGVHAFCMDATRYLLLQILGLQLLHCLVGAVSGVWTGGLAGGHRPVHRGAGARARASGGFYELYLVGVDRMDKRTTRESSRIEWSEQEMRLIQEGQQRIRASMPEVYKTIQRYAEKDAAVWRLVRMGLAGRPGCFWACEGAVVAGTPFTRLSRAAEISRLMARMGCAHVCIVAGHGDLGAA